MFQATCGTSTLQTDPRSPHVTSMQSPTNPSYAATGGHLVKDVQYLRTEPTLDNIAAHQACLEKLQFEHKTLRSWSNMVQDQIAGEAQQVHLQLMQMIQAMQHRSFHLDQNSRPTNLKPARSSQLQHLKHSLQLKVHRLRV